MDLNLYTQFEVVQEEETCLLADKDMSLFLCEEQKKGTGEVIMAKPILLSLAGGSVGERGFPSDSSHPTNTRESTEKSR